METMYPENLNYSCYDGFLLGFIHNNDNHRKQAAFNTVADSQQSRLGGHLPFVAE